MDVDVDGLPFQLIPDVTSVSVSADGRTLVVGLSLCYCSCDVEPFSMPIRLD